MQTNNHVPPMQHFENLFQECFVDKGFASTVDALIDETFQLSRDPIPSDPVRKNRMAVNIAARIKQLVILNQLHNAEQIAHGDTAARRKIVAMAKNFYECRKNTPITAIVVPQEELASSTPPVTPANRHTSSQREKAPDRTPQFGSTVQPGRPKASPENAKERLIKVTSVVNDVSFNNVIAGKHPGKKSNYAAFSVEEFFVDVTFNASGFYNVEIHRNFLEYNKSNLLFSCSPERTTMKNSSHGTRLTICAHDVETSAHNLEAEKRIPASTAAVKSIVNAQTRILEAKEAEKIEAFRKANICMLWVAFRNDSEVKLFKSEILCLSACGLTPSGAWGSYLKDGPERLKLTNFLDTLSCSVCTKSIIARPLATIIPDANLVHQPDLKRKFDESGLAEDSNPAKRQMVTVDLPPPQIIEIDSDSESEIEIDLNKKIPWPEVDD